MGGWAGSLRPASAPKALMMPAVHFRISFGLFFPPPLLKKHPAGALLGGSVKHGSPLGDGADSCGG